MHNSSNILTFFFMLLAGALMFMTSCVEEYWPELGAKYEEVLVVDGQINDKPGPYQVVLSLSTKVEQPFFVPLTGAQVTVNDNLGNIEYLNEVEEGVYQTSNLDFTGIVGRSYQLKIITENGKQYESNFEELKLSTGIDSVYAKIEYNYSDELGFDLPGYQFYITTHAAESDSSYFLWQLERTFKFNSNHTLKFIFDGTYHTANKYDSLYTCWATGNVNGIFTYSTENLAEPNIQNFPLHFVSTENKDLSVRYSLLVKQLSITKKAYEFWNSISSLEVGQGSLFTSQPYQISGNIKSTNDDKEPVLGYFLVGGLSEKRIFVERPVGVNFYYPKECALITEDLYRMLLFMRSYWPVLLTTIVNEAGGLTRALPLDQSCIDCQQALPGSSLDPPEFWVE